MSSARAARRDPRREPGWRRLLLVLGGLGLGLALAEGIARQLEPPPGTNAPLVRGQLTTPGPHRVATSEYDVTVTVNDAGFVDGAWGPKVGPRVLLLGDSFVQAAQVAPGEGLGAQLEARLGVEVRSLGVPGVGTAAELALLEEHGLALAPDLVVLGFLVANDVLNNHPLLDPKVDKRFYRAAGGGLVPVDPTLAAAPFPALADWSRLYTAFARSWTRRALVAAQVEAGEGVPLDFRVYDPRGGPRWDEAWALTDGALGALADRCAAHGVPLGILLFPDQLQVSPAARARLAADWPEVAAWDLRAAQARAAAMAGAVAPTVDLLPAMEGREGLYYPRDGHWTPAGHALAAEIAAPAVRGWLSPR